METISSVINHLGGVTKAAKILGLVPMAICQWRKRGIPSHQVLKIYYATKGVVTPHQIRPDLYPTDYRPPIPAEHAQNNHNLQNLRDNSGSRCTSTGQHHDRV